MTVVDVVIVEAECARAVRGQDADEITEPVEQRVEEFVVLFGAERDDPTGATGGLQRHPGERRAAARALGRTVDDVDRQIAQHGHTVDEFSRHRSISRSSSARSRHRGAKCYR